MAYTGLKHVRVPLALLLFLSLFTKSVTAVDVTVSADIEKWVISETLVGVHFVYSNDADAVYADGEVAAWANEVGIGIGRFPGGTVVKFWDWENPTGVLTGDHWNPNWNPADNAPDSEWMSLDEYLTFVDQSGIRPMFGVNMLSGKKHNRKQDSIDRAVRMVQYVKDRGYGGAIWYLGNEEEHLHGGGIAKYARTFKDHALAMKAVDPDILAFWNVNGANGNNIKTFLANDGGTADGLETHGKWPFGGDPNLPPGTFDEWTVEIPVRDRKNANRAWRFAANTYRNAAKEAGRPGLLIANNEYGLGKSKNVVGFDRYTKGLLLTDMLQEHVIGNWYSTAFWSNVLNSDEGSLLSRGNNFRLNPMHLGMGLISKSQGAMLVQSSTNFDQVYGFSAKTETELQVYLINKSAQAQPINIAIDGIELKYGLTQETPLLDYLCSHLEDYAGQWWAHWLEKTCADRTAVATSMVDTVDKFGEYTTADLSYDDVSGTFTGTLPALSYTRIVFPRKAFPFPSQPDPVADLIAVAGDQQVQLSWTHPGDFHFAEYRVYRGNNPNAPFDLIATNLTDPTFIDTDVVNGATYLYRVHAVNNRDSESLGVEVNAEPVSNDDLVASFNASVKEDDTNAANLNAGTAVGSWEGIPAAGVDIGGKPGNNALRIDQVAGGFAVDGIFSRTDDVDGLTVDLKVALRRTAVDSSKDITIAGLDPDGNTAFELVLGANTTVGDDKRLYYMDPVNGVTAIPQSLDGDLQFMNDTFAPEPLRRIQLTLTATGYVVNFNAGAWTSAELPFSGSATTVNRLRFSGGAAAGVWVDAITVTR